MRWRSPKAGVSGLQKLGVPPSGVINIGIIQYLGGQGDFVSMLIMGINGLTVWITGAMKLLTKSLGPSK